MKKIIFGLVVFFVTIFFTNLKAQTEDAERVRMQQEYQRIKPVIDKEWCSSWASVGDDRCFWDKAGARRSSEPTQPKSTRCRTVYLGGGIYDTKCD